MQRASGRPRLICDIVAPTTNENPVTHCVCTPASKVLNRQTHFSLEFSISLSFSLLARDTIVDWRIQDNRTRESGTVDFLRENLRESTLGRERFAHTSPLVSLSLSLFLSQTLRLC